MRHLVLMSGLLIAPATLVGCQTQAATAEQVAAATATSTLRVDGMTCGSCGVAIKTVARGLDGVAAVEVDVDAGTASVSYDPNKVSADTIAAAITDLGYPATVRTRPSAEPVTSTDLQFGVDPAMAAVCEASCAADFDYDPADVVLQPGAHVGDLTQCPVSGVVFVVRGDQPSYVRDGQTWFTCCGTCMQKLKADPGRFLRG